MATRRKAQGRRPRKRAGRRPEAPTAKRERLAREGKLDKARVSCHPTRVVSGGEVQNVTLRKQRPKSREYLELIDILDGVVSLLTELALLHGSEFSHSEELGNLIDKTSHVWCDARNEPARGNPLAERPVENLGESPEDVPFEAEDSPWEAEPLVTDEDYQRCITCNGHPIDKEDS